MAIEQVPVSVKLLKDQVHSYYKLNNPSNTTGVELMVEECIWDSFSDCSSTAGVESMAEEFIWDLFKQSWIQKCAWIPLQKEETVLSERVFSSRI